MSGRNLKEKKMTNKWMKKLESDFAKVASSIDAPSTNVIRLASPSFNWAVGNGGITEGKAVCFFGPESSGKSLLSQLCLIELQKKHPESIQILIDAEFSFNPNWFQKLGGDLDRLLVKQTNDPIEIFDWMEKDVLEMLQDGAPINGLMIDSVKSIRYRGPLFKFALTLFIISFVALGYLGTQAATPGYTLAAQIFSVIYFAFSVSTAIYTKIDKDKPVPERVTFQ